MTRQIRIDAPPGPNFHASVRKDADQPSKYAQGYADGLRAQQPKSRLDEAYEVFDEDARKAALAGPPAGALTASSERRGPGQSSPAGSRLDQACERADEDARKAALGGAPAGAQTRTRGA